MRTLEIKRDHPALAEKSHRLARLGLKQRAHVVDAFSVADEDTAMILRRVTGGSGAPIKVATSQEVKDPRTGTDTVSVDISDHRGVLILSPDNCTPGGIQRYTWSWGEAVLDLGLGARTVTIWKKGTVSGQGVSRWRAGWYALRALAAALYHRPSAVVAAHLSLAPVARLISKLFRAPYAVALHGNEAWRGGWSRWTDRAIRQADMLIPVSHFTANVMIRSLGMDRSRLYVTGGLLAPELQLNAEKYRRTTVGRGEQKGRYLLTVARLDLNAPYKRHDLVIRAVAELRDDYPDLRYHIVGDGPYRAELEALAEKLEVADRVDFLGRLSERELARENAGAYAFVMPSRISLKPSEGEGFGFAYLEAGIYGVPSIAANGGGSTETVLDGITGILVEPDSLQSLVAAIRKLLDDRALRDRLGAEAPRRAIEFSYPIFRRKCAAVLAALAEGKDPREIEPEHDPHEIAGWARVPA